MTFEEAKNTIVPFGDYLGLTIDQAATTDTGLLFLDRLRGSGRLYGKLKDAIEVYLSDPTIERELASILENR
jgi:hypothetical protein